MPKRIPTPIMVLTKPYDNMAMYSKDLTPSHLTLYLIEWSMHEIMICKSLLIIGKRRHLIIASKNSWWWLVSPIGWVWLGMADVPRTCSGDTPRHS